MFLVVKVNRTNNEIVFGTENKTLAEEFINNYEQRWLIVSKKQMLCNKLTILKNKIPRFHKSSFYSDHLKTVLAIFNSENCKYLTFNENGVDELKQKVEQENIDNDKRQQEYDEKMKEVEENFMKSLTEEELTIFNSNIFFENFSYGSYQIVEIPSYENCPGVLSLKTEPIDLYQVTDYKIIRVVCARDAHNPLGNYKEY